VNLDLKNISITDHQKKYGEVFPDPFDPKINKGSVMTFNFISRYVKTPGYYLDIGCGNGSLLRIARENGWKVKGLELSDFMARNIREQLDIDVEVSDFLDYEGRGDRYDLITLRHVLEHLPDSRLALKKIHNLLHDGGHAEFEFPNIEGISMKFSRFIAKTGIYRKRYHKDYVPGHCNEFSNRSFKYLLSVSGFELIRWETYTYNPLKNFIYNRFKIGSKARAIVKKVSTK
jgi:2-polyprenyl-3-methyl-5-hydroxy-6-metoxy-1,4-benzoquinol methylase